MNRDTVCSLDACLNELHEEQYLFQLHTPCKANLENRSWELFNISVAKDLDFCFTLSKKFCNYCKKDGQIIKQRPISHTKKIATTFIVSVGASSACVHTGNVQHNALTRLQTWTPEFVCGWYYSFSALGLLGKSSSTHSYWYFNSGASNHMTNNAETLTNVTR